jgi:hypothetical protein
MFSAGVISGLTVAVSTQGTNVSCSVGGKDPYQQDVAIVKNANGESDLIVGNGGNELVTLPTAPPLSSQWRIDSIVIWKDNTLTTVENNGYDTVGLTAVSGDISETNNAVPPTEAQIRAAIPNGQQAFYAIIANIGRGSSGIREKVFSKILPDRINSGLQYINGNKLDSSDPIFLASSVKTGRYATQKLPGECPLEASGARLYVLESDRWDRSSIPNGVFSDSSPVKPSIIQTLYAYFDDANGKVLHYSRIGIIATDLTVTWHPWVDLSMDSVVPVKPVKTQMQFSQNGVTFKFEKYGYLVVCTFAGTVTTEVLNGRPLGTISDLDYIPSQDWNCSMTSIAAASGPHSSLTFSINGNIVVKHSTLTVGAQPYGSISYYSNTST